jgi:hypothetical protein
MSAIVDSQFITGRSLYFVVRDTLAQIWNGTAFETYNASNWVNYVQPMSEQIPSGFYFGWFPTAILAGNYTMTSYAKLDPTPAPTDQMVAVGNLIWNGTSEDVQISTDTMAELLQGVPPMNPTQAQALMAMYMSIRNQVRVSETEKKYTNSAGVTIFKKLLSDNGVEYVEQKVVTGP